jgi:hypothetical protein
MRWSTCASDSRRVRPTICSPASASFGPPSSRVLARQRSPEPRFSRRSATALGGPRMVGRSQDLHLQDHAGPRLGVAGIAARGGRCRSPPGPRPPTMTLERLRRDGIDDFARRKKGRPFACERNQRPGRLIMTELQQPETNQDGDDFTKAPPTGGPKAQTEAEKITRRLHQTRRPTCSVDQPRQRLTIGSSSPASPFDAGVGAAAKVSRRQDARRRRRVSCVLRRDWPARHQHRPAW